jgi:hypothetical protein
MFDYVKGKRTPRKNQECARPRAQQRPSRTSAQSLPGVADPSAFAVAGDGHTPARSQNAADPLRDLDGLKFGRQFSAFGGFQ